jgi:hypothetical protein
MNVQRYWKTVKVAVVWALLALLLPAGCSHFRQGHLQSDYMPSDRYLVGGGMMIEWTAPADGTAYLVEKESGKIVETRSMAKGDAYSFSVSSVGQAREFDETLGIKLSDARFLLYFEPDEP